MTTKQYVAARELALEYRKPVYLHGLARKGAVTVMVGRDSDAPVYEIQPDSYVERVGRLKPWNAEMKLVAGENFA
jgi:hypothetical protein